MRRKRQKLPFAARIALFLGLEPDALVHGTLMIKVGRLAKENSG